MCLFDLAGELYSYGSTPYGDMPPTDVLVFTQQGKRLEQPEQCPDGVFAQIAQCWDADPEERPKFAELHQYFVSLSADSASRDLGLLLSNQTEDSSDDYV